MQSCIMCQKEFEKKDLDFVGRCEGCFRDYCNMPEDMRPSLTPASKKWHYYKNPKYGRISLAHKKDAELRTCRPDGSVDRNAGRIVI